MRLNSQGAGDSDYGGLYQGIMALGDRRALRKLLGLPISDLPLQDDGLPAEEPETQFFLSAALLNDIEEWTLLGIGHFGRVYSGFLLSVLPSSSSDEEIPSSPKI